MTPAFQIGSLWCQGAEPGLLVQEPSVRAGQPLPLASIILPWQHRVLF